jgi:feruloyl-CoA synthase
MPLVEYTPDITSWLAHWARESPTRTFLAERRGDGSWRRLTYADAAAHVASIAAALRRNGWTRRPVMALSGNSIDQALLMLACFTARVPFAPVSPAYSLMSRDFSKLRYIAELIEPGLVYADPVAPFTRALAALEPRSIDVLPSIEPLLSERGDDLDLPFDPDSTAKILFTSGSTGQPKAVINTHRMLAVNQQMMLQCWPFLAQSPPVLLDWLPWNHTFGGNHNFNMVLRHGGTLFIDGGRPVPPLIAETVRNLRDVSPTIYFNVPSGFASLLPHLEEDDELAHAFLRDLALIFYAGAALPQDLWTRLERLAIRHLGAPIAMTSAWGTTETSPLATSAHFAIDRAGVIGLPVPGVEIKLAPYGTQMEIRARGPNVTPGYFGRPDLTRDAFDDEGFYRSGDAGRFADPDAPGKGLLFAGRIAEDFKLQTGTWVHVGALRVAVLTACAPALQDAVICGHDREEVGIIAWAAPTAVGVCETIRAGLARHNRGHAGRSERVARVLLLSEPPSIDANEITDKGYINQRAVLERRCADVDRLFGDDADVIVISA